MPNIPEEVLKKAAELANERWVRLPRPGSRFYGMCRSTLDHLCMNGTVRSVVLRKPGAIRGIRLMYLPSLDAYLNQLESEQKAQPAEA